MMVKLTIVGRVSDGLPLAQGPRYANEGNEDMSAVYKQQGEFLLKEISRGCLPHSKMTILLMDHHHCFNYIVENGICFMVLCDTSYPSKLAFIYLQDLKREFEKFDIKLTDRIMRPYSFIRFEGIIGNIRRTYVDTRTQLNLSKLNSNSSPEADAVSESFSQIVKRRRRFDMLDRMSEAHLNTSPIWCSKTLEIIALKWVPVGMILSVATILLWSSLIRRDDLLSTGF